MKKFVRWYQSQCWHQKRTRFFDTRNFLKTKIKSHGDEVTDFYNKKTPKAGSNRNCFAVISLDSALKKDGIYYPQVFLKQCKYTEQKLIRYINDNLIDFFSSDKSYEE